MGGYGSGRQGGRVTIEGTASYVLSARALRGLRLGVKGGGQFTFRDDFAVGIAVDAREHDAWMVLEHPSRATTGPARWVSYRVGLTWTAPRFGGRRWWWRCPLSARRCGTLYLPLGADCFASRQAYRLVYQCQRETPMDRAMRKTRKLHRALGGDGTEMGEEVPLKPKGMHWRTYERLVARWQAAEARADQFFIHEVARRFGCSF